MEKNNHPIVLVFFVHLHQCGKLRSLLSAYCYTDEDKQKYWPILPNIGRLFIASDSEHLRSIK